MQGPRARGKSGASDSKFRSSGPVRLSSCHCLVSCAGQHHCHFCMCRQVARNEKLWKFRWKPHRQGAWTMCIACSIICDACRAGHSLTYG